MSDEYSEQETQRRMENAIRRAQKMPHKPHGKNPTGKSRKSPKAKDRAKTKSA